MAVNLEQELKKADREIEHLTAEGGIKDEVIRDAMRAIRSLPQDALGFGESDCMRWPLKAELLDKLEGALSTVSGSQPTITEKCMFCETRIDVPEPNAYAVICAPCRQKAYETAEKCAADSRHDPTG